ncbi:MAG: LCP family protein, partial [Firmicutes bacterium]|nr:LCP family protein [Bacillota bacterium]
MGKHSNIQMIDQPKVKLRKKQRLFFFCFWVFCIAIVILALGFAYIYKITPKGSHNIPNDVWIILTKPSGDLIFENRDRINILCLGIDDNWTQRDIMYTKNARSDTIFVIGLSRNKDINIISIPRDTRTIISEQYGYDKINAAYALGGIDQAKKTISAFLGVPIDYYVILKIEGAKKLVDILGGISVNVEKDMDYDDSWGHLHIHLKKGWQRLNGADAVGYARFRHDPEGDWGRIRRQQQVLDALKNEIKKVKNISKIDKIVKNFKENLKTDLGPGQMVDAALFYKDMQKKDFRTATITGTDDMISGISYIIPDINLKDKLVKKMLLGDTTPLPSEIKIEVLNGSKIPGLAGKCAERLRVLGYQITNVANASRSDYISTIVIEHKTSGAATDMMKNLMGNF